MAQGAGDEEEEVIAGRLSSWAVVIAMLPLGLAACSQSSTVGAGGGLPGLALEDAQAGGHEGDAGPGDANQDAESPTPDAGTGDDAEGSDGAEGDAAGGEADSGEGEDAGDGAGESDGGDAGDAQTCPGSECAGACCAENETCFEDACCVPQCAGRSCGDDGCGGSCGDCQGCGGPDAALCQNGACMTICCPNCAGKSCGPDGCGGICGSCQAPESCVSGECGCAPQCAGKLCGDDGCGDYCGVCPLNHSCQPDGSCLRLSDNCLTNEECGIGNFCDYGKCLEDKVCLAGESCTYHPTEPDKFVCLSAAIYQGHLGSAGQRNGMCVGDFSCPAETKCVRIEELLVSVCMGECSINQLVNPLSSCAMYETCREHADAPPNRGFCFLNGWAPGMPPPFVEAAKQNGPCDFTSGLSECRYGTVCTNLDGTGAGICLSPCRAPQSRPICPKGTMCGGVSCVPAGGLYPEIPYQPDPLTACPPPNYACDADHWCGSNWGDYFCEPLCVRE